MPVPFLRCTCYACENERSYLRRHAVDFRESVTFQHSNAEQSLADNVGATLQMDEDAFFRPCEDCESHYCDGDCQYADSEPEYDPYSSGMLGYGSIPNVVTYRKVTDTGRLYRRSYETHSRRYPIAPDSEPYLGFELELEATHGRVSDIVDSWMNSGHGWATHDGSLCNGAECKTHPSTYAFLARSDFADSVSALARAGGRAWSHDTTGLHTHVSRKAFTKQVHEWLFTWLQVSAFRDEVMQLAGRNDAHYAQWPVKGSGHSRTLRTVRLHESELSQSEMSWLRRNESGFDSRESAIDYLLRARSPLRRQGPQNPLMVISGKETKSDRSVAVNVNTDTIELRYWKGTLSGPVVLGQGAFIDALVKYSSALKVTPATRRHVSWNAFSRWSLMNLPGDQIRDIARLCASRHVPFAPTLRPSREV